LLIEHKKNSMKKLPFYIAVGIAVAAVSAFVIMELRRRTQPLTPESIPHGPDYLFNDQSNAVQTFKGFNLRTALNKRTKNATAEITALQHMINAYYGTNTLAATGQFDTPTANAVRDIEGKSTTNLYEFIYFYLVPHRGLDQANTILQSLTTNAG
jgi:hypothetical protein